MQCISPLSGYRGLDGKLSFDRQKAFNDQKLTVPCGHCMPCRITENAFWAARNVQENYCHENGIFLTLTYSDEWLPHGETLIADELSKFMRRLRKKISVKIRYYGCGEYGDTTLRPHYHALIHGYRPDDAVLIFDDGKTQNFTSETLDEIWGLGFAQFSDLTYASAAYTAGYTRKKIYGDAAEEHYQKLDPETGEIFQRLPEFSCMSNRPGIGIPWLEEFYSDVYPKSQMILNGKPMPVPRTYDRWLEANQPDLWDETRVKRAKESFEPLYQFKDASGDIIQHGHFPERWSDRNHQDRHTVDYKGSSRQLLTGQKIRDLKSNPRDKI